MKPVRTMFVLVGIVGAVSVLNLYASSYIGVFAEVAKVVMEPNEISPQKIQIWGTFIVPVSQSSGNYQDPQRGYLYFSIPPSKEGVVRNEWADIKSVAGKNQSIGFGEYWVARGRGDHYSLEVRVRKESEQPRAPDPYPTGIGVIKVGKPLAELSKQQLKNIMPASGNR